MNGCIWFRILRRKTRLRVDGDANFDLIAMDSAGGVHWLERSAGAGTWSALAVGTVGVSNHGINSQGYRLADLEPGGRPEIVINEDPCYYFCIPANPQASNWPRVEAIAAAWGADEEVAVGDIDRDGDLDLVSIAWNAPRFVHLWRNDAPSPGTVLFADGFESGSTSAWSATQPQPGAPPDPVAASG